jgi:hypothetical protein
MIHIVDEVERMYESKGLSFRATLDFYLHNGYVFCRPDLFLMAKEEPDWWFVECAFGPGKIKAILECMPYRKKYVMWYRRLRDSRVRLFKTEQLERLLHANIKNG